MKMLYHVTVAFNGLIAVRKTAFGSKNVMGMKVDEEYPRYDEKPVGKCSLAL